MGRRFTIARVVELICARKSVPGNFVFDNSKDLRQEVEMVQGVPGDAPLKVKLKIKRGRTGKCTNNS